MSVPQTNDAEHEESSDATETTDKDGSMLMLKRVQSVSGTLSHVESIRESCKSSMRHICTGDISYVQPFILALITYLNTDLPDPNDRMALVSHISIRTTNVLSDLLQTGIESDTQSTDIPKFEMHVENSRESPALERAMRYIVFMKDNKREICSALFGIAVAKGGMPRALVCGFGLRQGMKGCPTWLFVFSLCALFLARFQASTTLAAIAGFALSDGEMGGTMAAVAILCYALFT